jgi:hypothetical protein
VSLFHSDRQRARLTSGVLSWLVSQLDQFDPPQEDRVRDVAPERIQPCRSRKAFGELGAALRLAQRAPTLRDHPDTLRLRQAWLAMAERRAIFFDIRRRHHLFPHAGVALATMQALCTETEGLRRTLQSVLARKFMDRTERSAWQKLDLKYYFDAGGLTHAFPSDEALLGASCLCDPPSLADVHVVDLYAITHLIFHLTDFGRHPLPGCGTAPSKVIADYVAGALAMCLYERDYDLATEFLICRSCLSGSAEDLDRVAADAICAAQNPAGFLPDRRWLAGMPATGDADTDRQETFFAVYHPTLVALFLVACDEAAEARS